MHLKRVACSSGDGGASVQKHDEKYRTAHLSPPTYSVSSTLDICAVERLKNRPVGLRVADEYGHRGGGLCRWRSGSGEAVVGRIVRGTPNDRVGVERAVVRLPAGNLEKYARACPKIDQATQLAIGDRR